MSAIAPVSVVIPTHQRPDLLRLAIESVLSQSAMPAELIVVEDSPRDDSVRSMVDRIRSSSFRNVVYAASSVGACAARNSGFRIAKHPYVAFLDDDDVWDSEFLSKTLDRIQQDSDLDVIVTGTTLMTANGMSEKAGCWSGIETCLLGNGGLGGQNALYRIECLRAVGGFDQHLKAAQDRDLQIRLITQGSRAAVILEPLVVVDQTHSEDRITVSDARADGVLAFTRKHSSKAPKRARLLMWLGALNAQRHSTRAYRRLIGNCWHGIAALRRVVWTSRTRFRH